MRCLLLSLAMIPTAIQFGGHNRFDSPAGAGRGFINPLTVEEMRQAKCLATMVYGEARGESDEGKVAVAYTSLNRARKDTVCKVVLAPKQYSIFNDNPALKAAAMSPKLEPRQKNSIDKNSWKKSTEIARLVLRKEIPDPTMGATHYVAYKSLRNIPYWTRKFHKTAIIGNHTFFRDDSKVIAINETI